MDELKKDISEIEKGCRELVRLCEESNQMIDNTISAMAGFPVKVFSKKDELRNDTVEELSLSEMTGLPIKIQK